MEDWLNWQINPTC